MSNILSMRNYDVNNITFGELEEHTTGDNKYKRVPIFYKHEKTGTKLTVQLPEVFSFGLREFETDDHRPNGFSLPLVLFPAVGVKDNENIGHYHSPKGEKTLEYNQRFLDMLNDIKSIFLQKYGESLSQIQRESMVKFIPLSSLTLRGADRGGGETKSEVLYVKVPFTKGTGEIYVDFWSADGKKRQNPLDFKGKHSLVNPILQVTDIYISETNVLLQIRLQECLISLCRKDKSDIKVLQL
jgi:hypothetical protein